jgi:hypothetical protein
MFYVHQVRNFRGREPVTTIRLITDPKVTMAEVVSFRICAMLAMT